MKKEFGNFSEEYSNSSLGIDKYQLDPTDFIFSILNNEFLELYKYALVITKYIQHNLKRKNMLFYITQEFDIHKENRYSKD